MAEPTEASKGEQIKRGSSRHAHGLDHAARAMQKANAAFCLEHSSHRLHARMLVFALPLDLNTASPDSRARKATLRVQQLGQERVSYFSCGIPRGGGLQSAQLALLGVQDGLVAYWLAQTALDINIV